MAGAAGKVAEVCGIARMTAELHLTGAADQD